MKVALGADSAGYQMKEKIKAHLAERGIETVDVGAYSAESSHYPEFAYKLATNVAEKNVDFGILICGTGIGISIAANKVKGIRCSLCSDVTVARLTRQHNDSNVLALGGRTTGLQTALDIVEAWIDTEFEGGRHQRRVDMLDAE